jgi:hypothetical protein
MYAQISSESRPVVFRLAGIANRTAAMGLLRGPVLEDIDPASVRRLLNDLQHHGVAGASSIVLAPLLDTPADELSPEQAEQVARRLEQVDEALENSPTPAAEWPAMRAVLGDDLLGSLLGVSASSLRRYAAAERDTPDPIALKLHWLALVVADLRGAYNDYGIRRWFDRPRAQLGGASPRTTLGEQWHPDSDISARVRGLAATLTGALPLAV